MRTEFYCPRWGCEEIVWEDFVVKVKTAGYNGIEWGLPATTTEVEMENAWNLAAKHNLSLIPQHWDTVRPDFSRHYDQYAAWLEKISPYPFRKVNLQTGRDIFSFEQNRKLIELANSYFNDPDRRVVHETHRGKFSFSAHGTREFLEKIPELRITLDASHWVNVAESFLEDQEDTMKLAISRTDHIHARVGYPEGPQVPDPSAPEWQPALVRHIEWWDAVADRLKNEASVAAEQEHGAPAVGLTITPEFGPYPYMVPLPFSRQPIANQWDVNCYMMQRLRERYG